MTKTEQLQYILTTPVSEMDTSLITENFTKEEVNWIIVQKFYNGNPMWILMELADSINGIYNTLSTVVPIQTLAHMEEARSHYLDIKLLHSYLDK